MDVITTRIVIVSLATICALSVFGAITLASHDQPIPPILGFVATTTVGAIVGILAVPRQPPFR